MIKHTTYFAIQKEGNLIKQIGKCSILLPKNNNDTQKIKSKKTKMKMEN